MKKYFAIVIVCVMALCSACNNKPLTPDEIYSKTNPLVTGYFKDYQSKYPDWYETNEGGQKFVESFREKITTDIEFAKACANYYDWDNFETPITDSETIGKYHKEDGEYGEIKSFVFEIPIKLERPMYDGETDIFIQYEIITPIPASEDHTKPYVNNATMCDSISKFIKKTTYNIHPTIYVGTYLIGKES